MELHWIDVLIIAVYLVGIIVLGLFLSRWASKDLDAYFLAGKSLPWYVIGTSHGASGFDITGTMWFVTMLFVYGLKAAFIPWVWPLFDRIFRQVYLGPWIRRSNVLTGAEWMRTRFGTGQGGNLAHISVVVYALVATLVFLGYAFQGIGKFADVFFPDIAWGGFTSAEMYGIVILLLTTAYLLLGGWYSVVLTDLIQFFLLTAASVCIAVIAMNRVGPEELGKVVPEGWNRLLFGLELHLDWGDRIAQLNEKIEEDGFSLFGIMVMMWLSKGILVSVAGPTPGYGMQHVLSTRNPREAALENWWMSIVQIFPRMLMIAGIAVLGLVFFTPEIKGMLAGGKGFDFERILPHVIGDYVPVGLVGILLAGLLAAFMSTFDSTVNAGAAYVVNDIYKRYIHPNAPPGRYMKFSYLCVFLLVLLAIIIGLQMESIHSVTRWITVCLYGGYLVPNILKWHWWRFNGQGYFAGMIAGVLSAVVFALLFEKRDLIYAFPVISLISAAASVVVCLKTPPERDEILVGFYRNVRPWGFWTPVYRKILEKHPDLKRNENFRRDAFNVALGIVWQLMLTVVPVCLVIREWTTLWISLAVLAVTSAIMKFTWYDKLGPGDMYLDDVEEEPAR